MKRLIHYLIVAVMSLIILILQLPLIIIRSKFNPRKILWLIKEYAKFAGEQADKNA